MSKISLGVGHRTIQTYLVSPTCDTFKSRGERELIRLEEGMYAELFAYYNGELVTPWMVIEARALLCRLEERPLPMETIGRELTLKCTDGDYHCPYDVGTLRRYFEYIADLYEYDPSLSSVDLPH